MRTVLFIRRNLALMLFDDCLCHRKPYTVTAREFSCFIGSVEAVESAVQLKLVHGCIGILHRQHNLSGTLKRYANLTSDVTVFYRIIH